MAHNIATINDAPAFTYLDQSPWHGLGRRLSLANVPPAQRIDAALDAAQLRWTVGSLPIFLADGTEITNHRASVRYADDGTVAAQLGVVGKAHTHSQNVQNVDILRPLAEEFGVVPAAAGALGKGERVWFLLRMADAKVTPLDGDDVNGYLLMYWNHDGQGGINGQYTTVRVVCQNTLALARRAGKAFFSIRHTTNVAARLDDAARLVKDATQAMVAAGDTFAALAHRQLTAQELDAYIAAAIPNTTATGPVSPVIAARRDTVSRLVFYGRGAALANQYVDTTQGGASAWAALNSVTEYIDHVRTAEAQSPAGLLKAQHSAIFGQNAEIKAGAFTLARQLVAA